MRKGFTIVEILVAVSLFAIASTVATTLLVNVVNLQKKASVQNAVYEDARILLQQLTKEIQGGTIDYEEYYSMNVAQKGAAIPEGGPYYGINYGVYASRFFDPGKQLSGVATINPDDLGVECSFPNPLPANKSCEIVYNLSSDFSTGQNPYKRVGSFPKHANALCDMTDATCLTTSPAVDELYLIDSTGTRKTIIGRKLMPTIVGSDYTVGLIRMMGVDFDQNGFIDMFTCTDEFTCEAKNIFGDGVEVFPFLERLRDTLPPADQDAFEQQYENLNIRLPKQLDLNTAFDIGTTQFLPITPIKSSVKGLKFVLNPIEDPYKAYAEDDVQQQPSVTIILTMGLNEATANDYPGTFQDITVQTTVAAGVIGKLQSYPSVNDYIRSNLDTSWISDVLPITVNR